MTKLYFPTPAGRAGDRAYPDLMPGESAPFGNSVYYQGFHHGIDWYFLNRDIAGSRKVYSAAVGVVTEVKHDDATLGNWVTVQHARGVQTRYCHMAAYPEVPVGDRVNTDTYLGPMGNTGSAAHGQYHLHFELWINGVRVDPAPYFTQDLPGTTSTAAESSTVIFATVSEDLMARLYRQTSSGTIIAANIDTGFRWDIPNMDYVALMRARKLVVDEDAVELADNEWQFLMTLLAIKAAPAVPSYDVAITQSGVTFTGTATPK